MPPIESSLSFPISIPKVTPLRIVLTIYLSIHWNVDLTHLLVLKIALVFVYT